MLDENLILHLSQLKNLLQQFKENNEVLEKEKSSLSSVNLNIAQNNEVFIKAIESLDQVGPAVVMQIQEASMQEAKNIFTTLVDEVGKNIDLKLNDFCKKLNNESIKINKISDNYKKLSRKLLLTIIGIAFLCGAIFGVIGGHMVLKQIKKITGFFSYTVHK